MPSTPSSLPASHRTLIVRLGAIGDVVNALTLAAALKDHAPETHIGWLVHPLSRPLVDNNPVVDRVHCVPRKGLLGSLAKLRAELAQEHYSLVIDLQRMQKSALLARQARTGLVLGYDRARCKEWAWWWYNERIPAGPPRAHMVEQYAEFARHLGVRAPIRHSLPAPSASLDAWYREALEPEVQTDPIVVHIGASKPENRWRPDRYREVVQGLLSNQPRPVLLTGGPGDLADAGPTEAACSPNPRFQSLVGKTSLEQLQRVLRTAKLFLGCDTGPMHLAAALKVPVLALFGPADPIRTGPYGSGHRVLRIPGASPLRKLEPASMDSVSSSDTLQIALEMLHPEVRISAKNPLE